MEALKGPLNPHKEPFTEAARSEIKKCAAKRVVTRALKALELAKVNNLSSCKSANIITKRGERTMKAKFEHYTINSHYDGEKKAPWGTVNGQENFHHHNIYIYNTHNKKRIRFDFWGSIVNPELRSPYDLRNAFHCFVSDAISGLESFETFCDNFGYDNDSIKALNTYKACQKALIKAQRVIDGDLYDFINELGEVAA